MAAARHRPGSPGSLAGAGAAPRARAPAAPAFQARLASAGTLQGGPLQVTGGAAPLAGLCATHGGRGGRPPPSAASASSWARAPRGCSGPRCFPAFSIRRPARFRSSQTSLTGADGGLLGGRRLRGGLPRQPAPRRRLRVQCPGPVPGPVPAFQDANVASPSRASRGSSSQDQGAPPGLMARPIRIEGVLVAAGHTPGPYRGSACRGGSGGRALHELF